MGDLSAVGPVESYPGRERAGEKWKGPAAPRPALPGQGRVTQIKGSASENSHSPPPTLPPPAVRLGPVLSVPFQLPPAAGHVRGGLQADAGSVHPGIRVGGHEGRRRGLQRVSPVSALVMPHREPVAAEV